jgi:serine/threonine protein kinase
MSINDYIFDPNERDLGEGGFGVVKRARVKGTNQIVAVKIIKQNPGESIDESILKEVEIWKKFDHPNIVKYYNHFEADHKLFIIMEYIDGEDLSTLINRRQKSNLSFTEEFICQVLSQMVSALSYVHRLKVIHRDIKLNNVLHSLNGQIKLVDFGISKISSSTSYQYSTLIGTPIYESPELIEGQYSFPTDVWSLGVMLYVMMTFKFPFTGSSVLQLMNNICYCPTPKIKQNFSNDLKETVYSKLNKDPLNRITLKELLSKQFIKEYFSNSSQKLENANLPQLYVKSNLQVNSEESFLNAIQQGDLYSIYNYALKFSSGIYEESKKKKSEYYMNMYYKRK